MDSLAVSPRGVFAARLRVDVPILRRRGMVPLAIADTLGISVSTVSKILREQGYEIPSYLTTQGPRAERARCPHCRKRL